MIEQFTQFTTVKKAATDKLLKLWRAGNKADDALLREKLYKKGWRYSRKNDRWYHPDQPALSAPRTLRAMAETIVHIAVVDAIDSMAGADDKPAA